MPLSVVKGTRWVVCALLVLLALPRPVTAHARDVEELPNLVPLPVVDVRLATMSESREPAVRFSVATANRGQFALDLFGHPDYPVDETTPAFQCIAWVTDRACETRTEVGTFVWHPQHGHYHFADFARYELRTLRRNGLPDMGDGGLVATSGKVSFCLIDVVQDRPPQNPLYLFPHPLYYTCLAGSGFQGISPGWRDVYSWSTPGQEFPAEVLEDGRFALVVRADPSDRLFETSNDDNFVVTGIEVSEDVTKVDVFCAGEPGKLRCLPL